MYVATEWITTKIEGTGGSDVINANSKLKDYIKRQKDAGMSGSETKSLTHTVLCFLMLIANST